MISFLYAHKRLQFFSSHSISVSACFTSVFHASWISEEARSVTISFFLSVCLSFSTSRVTEEKETPRKKKKEKEKRNKKDESSNFFFLFAFRPSSSSSFSAALYKTLLRFVRISDFVTETVNHCAGLVAGGKPSFFLFFF